MNSLTHVQLRDGGASGTVKLVPGAFDDLFVEVCKRDGLNKISRLNAELVNVLLDNFWSYLSTRHKPINQHIAPWSLGLVNCMSNKRYFSLATYIILGGLFKHFPSIALMGHAVLFFPYFQVCDSFPCHL